nr:hypothetical protein GCM10020093_105040 [Planobispora longispora]
MIERYGDHPLAVYARMAQGINAEREFKDITADKELKIRRPDTKESIQQLTAVADASARGEGVDNITLNMVMRRLARAQARQGDLEQATGTIDKMVRTFESKQLRPRCWSRSAGRPSAPRRRSSPRRGRAPPRRTRRTRRSSDHGSEEAVDHGTVTRKEVTCPSRVT